MMTLDDFKYMLDIYGSDPQAWPVDLRATAEALLNAGDENAAIAQSLLAETGRLDAMLKSYEAPAPESANLAERIIATATALPQDNPPARISGTFGWMNVIGNLLGVDVKPAWVLTPAGGLMASAILGFWLGMVQQPGVSDMLIDPAYYEDAVSFQNYDDIFMDEDVL